MPERIAIIGSRKFPNKQLVVDYVNQLPADAVIVSGGAHGPDTWAEEAARARGMAVDIYRVSPQDWDKYGLGAGMRRNSFIIDNCDRVVAFWLEGSKGTTDSRKKARARGQVIDTYYSNGQKFRLYPSIITDLVDDLAYLSNDDPYPISLDGITYPSVTHAFAAAHYRRRADREAVVNLGIDEVAMVRASDADRMAFRYYTAAVLEELMFVKFFFSPLGERLINTANATFGEDLQGQLLVKVRQRLRQGEQAAIQDILHGSMLYVRHLNLLDTPAIVTRVIPVTLRDLADTALGKLCAQQHPQVASFYQSGRDLRFFEKTRTSLTSVENSIIILLFAIGDESPQIRHIEKGLAALRERVSNRPLALAAQMGCESEKVNPDDIQRLIRKYLHDVQFDVYVHS